MLPVYVIDVFHQLVMLLFASRLNHANQLCFQLGYFAVVREQDTALVLASSGIVGVSIGISVVVVIAPGAGVSVTISMITRIAVSVIARVTVPLAVILVVSVISLILVVIAIGRGGHLHGLL